MSLFFFRVFCLDFHYKASDSYDFCAKSLVWASFLLIPADRSTLHAGMLLW